MSMRKRGLPREDLRCSAHKATTGERCQVAVIKGGTVCVYHGGSAPQVRAAAQAHIKELMPAALVALDSLVNDDSEKAMPVRLAAAKDILDRAGMAATTRHEVDVHDSTDERLKAALEALGAIKDKHDDA